MSQRRTTLGGYPAEGQYGNKKGDVAAILRHVPPGTTSLADPFGGTGVVAHAAKGLGIRVMANDIMAFACLRIRTFVENDNVALDEKDVSIAMAPNPSRGRTIGEWYGRALGADNADFLDGLAANIHLFDGEMKRDVAVCLAVLSVMRHMGYCSVSFGRDERFTGLRNVRDIDLRAEFRRMALDEFPRLLRDGGGACLASREDAIAFLKRTDCDVAYLDPPFPSPGGVYERDLAFYDRLVHALQGNPELVDRPRKGIVALPSHTDFTRRGPALMGINLLFRAARGTRRVIFSFNSTARIRPSEVIAAARRWYGGLAACDWTAGRRPTCSRRRRGTTANVLMVFDRGRPTASPKWTPGDVTFADLFAGVGGFRAALQAAGCQCVFSSEIDGDAVATYLANWADRPAGDIRAIAPDDVPEHQVLCAGFPCPAFSGAGKRGGYKDERGRLFFEIARIAAIRRPCVLLLENVSAFASPDKPWLLLAKEALEGIGYRVFPEVVNASGHGVPTARARTYLACFRSDLGIASFRFPQPSHQPVKLMDVLLPDSETDDCVVHDERTRIDANAVARAEGRVAMKLVQVGQIGEGKQGYRIYSPWGHAVTFLRRGGGIGAQTGLYLINGRVRKLTPREMARVMGFEDSFVIPASLSADQVRRLFGNSVAVPVVRRIFDRIAETLAPRGPTTPEAPSPEPPRDRAPRKVDAEQASTSATKGRGEA